jgi:glyoxylate utilization-related uncharacterized protein
MTHLGATGEDTGLFRWDMPASSGSSGQHFHRGFSESFYVISGTVRLFGGGKWAEVTEGGFLFVPTGEEWADLFARHDQVNL